MKEIMQLLNSQNEEDIVLGIRILGDDFRNIFERTKCYSNDWEERWLYRRKDRIVSYSVIVFEEYSYYLNADCIIALVGKTDNCHGDRKIYDFRTDKGTPE